jgi:hypothetical protein
MNIAPLKDRFDSKWMENESGCWIWAGAKSSSGYGNFWVSRGVTSLAHRVSFELYVGKIPCGMSVLHRCDTPFCVNPEHLFVGTHLDNMGDMSSKGRKVGIKGEKNRMSKLNDVQVVAIKAALSGGRISQQKIADMYGVDQTNVSQIKLGKSWAHINV